MNISGTFINLQRATVSILTTLMGGRGGGGAQESGGCQVINGEAGLGYIMGDTSLRQETPFTEMWDWS